MSGFLESLGESESTRKGMGAALVLDGIIILVVAIVNMVTGRSYDGLSSTVSGIIVIAIAVLLFISGVALLKEAPVGDILAWISALVSLVFGVITTFKILGGDMFFSIYYLLTGIIMIFYLLKRTVSERKA